MYVCKNNYVHVFGVSMHIGRGQISLGRFSTKSTHANANPAPLPLLQLKSTLAHMELTQRHSFCHSGSHFLREIRLWLVRSS